jgi:hypothetical protein
VKLVKQVFGLILAALFFIGMATPVHAFDDAGENPLSVEQRAYQRYERFSPVPQDGNRVFYTYGISATPGFVNPVPYLMNRSKRKLCPSLSSVCYSSTDQLEAVGYLPKCKNATQSPCIKTVWARLAEGDWVQGQDLGFVDLTPTQRQIDQIRDHISNTWKEQEILDENRVVSWPGNSFVPASATGALRVRFPGISNAAGKDTYIVKSVYNFSGSAAKSQYTEFFTNVIPYQEGILPNADTSVRLMLGLKSDKNVLFMNQSGSTGDATKFAWSENGRLGYAAAFSPNTRFKVELQLPDKMGGWFHGRMDEPQLSLSAISGETNLLAVEAAPAVVPVTAAFQPILQDGVFNPLFSGSEEHKKDILKNENNGQFGATGPIWEPSEFGMRDFTRHLAMLGDKAKGQASVWSVASINNIKGAPSCLNKPNTFQGLVTTDSMVYQAGIPEFKNGFLNYQVGGLHRNYKNEVIQGSYNLIMRSDSARCLYGFSKAPVSATISVIDSDGENINATTVMGETNGWLKLTAKGFTFSQKTIRVKMIQATAQKKTTITCVKGKISKRLTGIAPSCPIGYKKK